MAKQEMWTEIGLGVVVEPGVSSPSLHCLHSKVEVFPRRIHLPGARLQSPVLLIARLIPGGFSSDGDGRHSAGTANATPLLPMFLNSAPQDSTVSRTLRHL
ncbi:hypothetical protein GJAV_G00128090 [Gymnothorax javanicus]|nr:hypothetical protein GJAV_G00128090 [Gymnothorax javanicus]